MKRKIFELIRLNNTLREGKDFAGLDLVYSRLGEFLTQLRQMKRIRLNRLQGVLENEDHLLATIRLMEKSKRRTFEEIVFTKLQTIFDDQFEEMDVPYEVILEAAKVYADSIKRQIQVDATAKKKNWKGSEFTKNEQGTDEQILEKKEGWLIDRVLNKNKWIIVPICLNVLILLLCFKFGGHIMNIIYS